MLEQPQRRHHRYRSRHTGDLPRYFATQKGYKTLLMERNAWPSDASTRNFGLIFQTIVETGTEWSAFERASAEIYLRLQQEHDIGVQTSGSLYLATSEVEQRVLREFSGKGMTRRPVLDSQPPTWPRCFLNLELLFAASELYTVAALL